MDKEKFDQKDKYMINEKCMELKGIYDENGNELGGGKLTFVRGVYYLDPEDVTTYSVLNGTLSFTVEEWLNDKVIIKANLSDSEQVLIDLTKL